MNRIQKLVERTGKPHIFKVRGVWYVKRSQDPFANISANEFANRIKT